jgi:hypothetical protein
VERLLDAQPTYFQTEEGSLFFLDGEGVRPVYKAPLHRLEKPVDSQSDIIVALVDADKEISEPHEVLVNSHDVQIIATSSPKGAKQRKWLGQLGEGVGTVYIMDTWSSRELFVAGFALFHWFEGIENSSKSQDVLLLLGYHPCCP